MAEHDGNSSLGPSIMEQPLTSSLNDHDLLIRIATMLEMFQRDMSDYKSSVRTELQQLWAQKADAAGYRDTCDKVKDQEQRLRYLERRMWTIGGGLAVAMILIKLLWK